MRNHKWTEDEIKKGLAMLDSGKNMKEVAKALNRGYNSANLKLHRTKAYTPPSTMPVWNSPLESTGDAVIMSDVEAPFQHSEFINKVLDLAYTWDIKDLHLAGDLLHNDSLSAWGSEWTEAQEDTKETLLKILEKLDKKNRSESVKLLEEKGLLNDTTYSGEMKASRAVFKSFDLFEHVYVELGNHDDRFLRALDQAMAPSELLHQLDKHHDPRWKIAPYYYAILHTEKGDFRITHPRGAGRTTAQDLAVQFHQHVIMGHSHRWNIARDPSADYWAIQTGCCVDERRLPYVMQRDAKRDAHMNGATIVRGGYPFVLHMDSPWDLLKRM
jgi:hypothetical protein